MYKLKIHRDVEKQIAKAPLPIRKKAFAFLKHIRKNGSKDCSFSIKPLQGEFKRSKFFEVKIAKDYRIIFRKDGDTFYVRWAGTHNRLDTG